MPNKVGLTLRALIL
uniref:Uncharacterized protein n=1 Tax=Anguilla anguilla TaxID=7936 RepID=A0A0E9UYK3_ANGAN